MWVVFLLDLLHSDLPYRTLKTLRACMYAHIKCISIIVLKKPQQQQNTHEKKKQFQIVI